VIEAPADRLALEAERWLATLDGTKPFFLYLHFMDVHGQYNAPDSTYEQIRRSPTVQTDEVLSQEAWDKISPFQLGARWVHDEDGQKKPETRRVETWRGRYAAGVRDLDNRLDTFIKHMRESGLLDNIFVIFTSDHGEELYDHFNWDHGFTLYEDQIRVPLFIRPPAGLPAPREFDEVVGLIDLFPTLAGLTGEPLDGVDGKDLSPLMAGTGSGGSGVILSGAARTNPELVSLCVGSLKLILDGATNRLALFDVDKDPAEAKNLAEENPEQLRRMRTYLAQMLESAKGRSLFEPSTKPISQERRELLESLGYMN
jgi:arylsulfatase A-like enzyme